MDQDEILLDAEERMEKAVEVLHGQLQGLRTGRATAGLVDSIRVDVYGSPTPLKQVANVSVPEPQQIVIRPYDPNILGAISKAIQASDTGLSPNSDGRLIRLNIPPLSTERRRQLVGRVKELAEDARVAIRNIRRDANKHAEQAEKDNLLTEDDLKRCKDDIQDLTKKYEAQDNDKAQAKDTDVMEDRDFQLA
ncbi:MAG: ribosome recycling factor, partial [Planctomycetaceae bacterium]